MSLPAPRLDDRGFQDLVDDAKRLIALRCPEWSDHNVSDPGVTLIEAFAFLTDELLYRLNRVPDRLYVAFLDLLGVTLFPPTSATADVVFWLSAPRPDTVTVPALTEVATPRTELAEPVVFSTLAALEIPPRELRRIGAAPHDRDAWTRGSHLGNDVIDAFAVKPAPGDALLIGLDQAAPGLAISLRLDCTVRGVGVDPRNPPLAWEAWTDGDWEACDVVEDGTGGLNGAGDVVMIVPRGHAVSSIAGERAGWLRARLIEHDPGQPTYTASPQIRSAQARTVGAVTAAIHARTVDGEIMGLSEGVSGQQFTLAARPVVDDGDRLEVEVGMGSGWETWTEVRGGFADQPPDATVVQVDRTTGVVRFPPAVREADGSLRRYGAVPPKGAPLRVRRYRVGGGARGNVAPGALSMLRTTVPFVKGCVNRSAARGGTDGETVDEAKVRGPLSIRTLDRAVTLDDYAQLAKRAAPGIARVHAMAATGPDAAHGVRVLLVPSAAVDDEGRTAYEDLTPAESDLRLIADELEPRRTVGARVSIERPAYRGVTIVAKIVARPRAAVGPLREEALAALYRWFDPAHGGGDGEGWPFGRPVLSGEVYSVPGSDCSTEYVEDVLLFDADPETGKRGAPVKRIDLDPDALVFGFAHDIRVVAGVG